jgi:large subunit ribosomal protein L32
MAVPKRKTSKSRRDRRRTAKERLTPVATHSCPQCKAPKRPHRVCMNCGTYKGREVIAF